MSLSSRIKRITQRSGRKISWIYTLLLAVIPSAIIILIMPVNFDRFIIEKENIYNDRWVIFKDLENDGRQEKITLGLNLDSTLYLRFSDDRDILVEQFNFSHTMLKSRVPRTPYTVDVTGDSIREIIFLSSQMDSVFLNVFSFSDLRTVTDPLFITKIGGMNDKKDFDLYWVGDYDANGDRVPEIYFSISSAFALYPRRIYRYDYKAHTVIASVNTGAAKFKGALKANNQKARICLSGSARGNTRSDYPFPYHDTVCWYMELDSDLRLASEPVAFGSYFDNTGTPLVIGNNVYLLLHSNEVAPYRNAILKMDQNGKCVDSLHLPFRVNADFTSYTRSGKTFYNLQDIVMNISLEFDEVNFRLVKNRHARKFAGKRLLLQTDLDGDRKKEYVFTDRFGSRLQIFPANLRKSTIHELPDNYYLPATAGYFREQGRAQLALRGAEGTLLLNVFRNKSYPLKYFTWLITYMFSFLFVAAVMAFQNRRIEQRNLLEQRLANLQLQNLRNQLDPHFTFNALNTVGNAIYSEDKDKAYELFERFTRMIRSSLLVTKKVFRSLHEEITFTLDYLEFQKSRFRDLFDYKTDFETGLDLHQISIPKMLVQSFAENAVKHAFHNIDYKGEIILSVKKSSNSISISVDDNGIGIKRSKAEGFTAGTRQGEQILLEQVRQINTLYHKEIRLNIIDKQDENPRLHGTRVEIILPLN